MPDEADEGLGAVRPGSGSGAISEAATPTPPLAFDWGRPSDSSTSRASSYGNFRATWAEALRWTPPSEAPREPESTLPLLCVITVEQGQTKIDA